MTPLTLCWLGLVGLALAPSPCAGQAWSFRLTSGDGRSFSADVGAADLRGIDLAAEGRRLLARPQAVNATTGSTCQWTCGECSGLDDSLHSALANATCGELAGDLALCGASVISGELLRAVQAGQCQLVCAQSRQEARCRQRAVAGGAHDTSVAAAGPAHLLVKHYAAAKLLWRKRLHQLLPLAIHRRTAASWGVRADALRPAAAPASAAVAGLAAPDFTPHSSAVPYPAAAPGQPPVGSPASNCAPAAGCANKAEWACGPQQQWRLTRTQHTAAASAAVCSADLDASFCFLGRRVERWCPSGSVVLLGLPGAALCSSESFPACACT